MIQTARSIRHHDVGARQTGLTLIELMIAMVINLFIIGAAALLYLNSTRVSTQVEQQTRQQETAELILDVIGRDLINAGFWPATFISSTHEQQSGTFSAGYVSPITASFVASVASPVFGCDGGSFDQSDGARSCSGGPAGPDVLIVNYYNGDTLAAPAGPVDCLRQTLATTGGGTAADPVNVGRRPGTAGNPPIQPYFVQNVYSLGANQSVTIAGVTSQSRSFRCSGNGNMNTPQPLFTGLVDFQVWFGIYDGTTETPINGRMPSRYLTATQMAAEPTAETPWLKVAAVRVCIVSKTNESNTRDGPIIAYRDCAGNNVTPTDRARYSSVSRTIMIRHGQTNVMSLN